MGLGSNLNAVFTSRDLGIRVERPAALYDADTHSLFTIAGGNIMLKSLFGITSVGAVPGVGTTVQFRANATAGAAVVLDGGAADLTGAAIGTIFGITGTVGDNCGLGFAIEGMDQGFICPIGVIDWILGAASTPAEIAFVLQYVPLDPGATVDVT